VLWATKTLESCKLLLEKKHYNIEFHCLYNSRWNQQNSIFTSSHYRSFSLSSQGISSHQNCYPPRLTQIILPPTINSSTLQRVLLLDYHTDISWRRSHEAQAIWCSGWWQDFSRACAKPHFVTVSLQWIKFQGMFCIWHDTKKWNAVNRSVMRETKHTTKLINLPACLK
jgi:hypothetical protein